MIKMTAILKKEQGSVIIAAILLLVLLTVVGIAAVTTSNTELYISTNRQLHKMAFFVAEGGWHVMTAWLDRQYPLPTNDLGSQWTAPFLNFATSLSFGARTVDDQDHTGEGVSNGEDLNTFYDWVPYTINDQDYMFRVSSEYAGASIAPGWDPTSFLRFNYTVTSDGRISRRIRPAEALITVNAGKVQER